MTLYIRRECLADGGSRNHDTTVAVRWVVKLCTTGIFAYSASSRRRFVVRITPLTHRPRALPPPRRARPRAVASPNCTAGMRTPQKRLPFRTHSISSPNSTTQATAGPSPPSGSPRAESRLMGRTPAAAGILALGRRNGRHIIECCDCPWQRKAESDPLSNNCTLCALAAIEDEDAELGRRSLPW
jgi:hypothetical protein